MKGGGLGAREAMAAAMLSLPPTIEELHLAYLVCLEDGEQWAGRGVFAAFAAAIHGAVNRPVSLRAATVASHLPSACAAFRYPSARIVTERSSSASCQTHFALAVSEESLSSGTLTPSRVASDRMLAVGIEPCASANPEPAA